MILGGPMLRIAFVSICGLLALACAAMGGEPQPIAAAPPSQVEAADPDLADMGESRFQRYCASCHGFDARGMGPVARVLRTPPPDLRRIAARRGGDFPRGEIARKIDGRFEIAPHGTREMPVWGQAFGANVPAPGLGESVARGEIAVLVEYLLSIQDPPDVPADDAQVRAGHGRHLRRHAGPCCRSRSRPRASTIPRSGRPSRRRSRAWIGAAPI